MTLLDQCREVASKAIAEGVDVLPPWTGDDRAMELWLDQCLHYAQTASHVIRVLKVAHAKPAATAIDINNRAFAIKEARCGNIEPLRRLEPELAEFLHLPKQGVGKRFPKRKTKQDRVTEAALDAKRIKVLWSICYPGHHRHQHDSNDKSAEDFAAARWNVDIDKVHNRLKKRLPRLADDILLGPDLRR
jgi:hypothetical protein